MKAPKKHRPKHQQTKQQRDKARPNATDRGYDGAWRKLRKAFVYENPLCVDCLAEGKVTATQHVHHRLPIHSHPAQRLEWDNLVSLCESHHAQRHSGDGVTVWKTRSTK